MKTIVTGAAGFIGSHLAEKLLAMGHEVTGIDCFIDYYRRALKEKNLEGIINHPRFTFIEDNILNLDLKSLMIGVDYIFHQAAQAGVRASWGKSFEIYTENNIRGTQKLLEAARGLDIKKFVYASSSSVYGDTDELPMKEDNHLQPVSPYGVSKLAAEHLCYLYWKNFQIPVISLRYFTVFGERQRPDMAFHIFIKSILKRVPVVIYGDGKQIRNFTHVDDIIRANLLAAKSDIKGEVFNIGGDGEGVILNDTIDFIEKELGIRAIREYREVAKGDVRHTSADTTKARKLLGYKAEVGFKEGLIREINWLKTGGLI